jgi:DnaJ-domain-containing protein 1
VEEQHLDAAPSIGAARPSSRNAELSHHPEERAFPNAEPPAEQPLPAPAKWPLTLDAARRLLGVTAASTRDEIKAAYRQMASLYHPDHLARRGDRDRQLATDRMAAINEAYRLLCEVRLA